MPQDNFSATVDSWVSQTKARMDAVYKESAQRTIEIMQTPVAAGGNMPVDTGFLRASLMASLGHPLTGPRDNPGGAFTYDAGPLNLVIAGAKITDPIYAVYGANYARFQEYGNHGRQGRRFVALAAQQWPKTVATVAAEAKRRAGA